VSVEAVSALQVNAPRAQGSSSTLVLLRDGEEVARTSEASLIYTELEPGTYRVEVRASLPRLLWGDFMVPVLYSNRIRLDP
jgi:hypothetical protein